MSRTPQLLSTFAIELDMAVMTAYETGNLLVDFATKKEAMSKKFEFYRFFKSVNYYKPGSDLANVVNSLRIRYEGTKIELVKRSGEASNNSIRMAIAGKKAGIESHLDEEAAMLARLEGEPLINPLKDE